MSFVAWSQTQSGGMMVGANLSYYSINYKDSDSKNTYSSFSPSFGYFISDNFCVGLKVATSRNTSTTTTTSSGSSNFAVGPFARYYKFTSNESFAFFVEGGITFLSRRVEPMTGPDQKGSGFAFQISPGFSYFFTKHWSAELAFRGLRISSDNIDNSGGADYTQVDFGIESFTPSLGVRYYFGNN
jgi:outer membrane protein